MYGKSFASMYERSMVGSGAIVFAVWGYVISTARPDRAVGAQVTLNPTLLGTILGEEPGDVEKAIEFLCQPDPRSTTKEEEGRRLVKLGEFDYRVVNYAKYRKLRDEEARREQNREAQERFRERERKGKGPGALYRARERRFVKADARGDVAEADRIAGEGLPETGEEQA